MKSRLKLAAIFAAIALITPTIDAKTLSIAIDKSGSNPLLTNENFAYSAAQFVSSKVLKLEVNDVVNVKTFGAREEATNVITSSFTISRRVSPQKVAEALTQYIQALPGDADGSQNSTNLIAYLEFTSGFDCDNAGNVLVITDGLESSSLVSAGSLLEGTSGLPDPLVELQGCSVTFYGLGAGWQPQSVRHIRQEWINWFKQAGAEFTAIIP